MNQFLEEQYKNLGISREVYEFRRKNRGIFKGDVLAEIDARARIQPDESHKSDAGEPRQRRMF
mgnify:CR=1 FL=1